MATVDENKQQWDGRYNWRRRGDEWSVAWGGPEMQWYGTILPRISRFVPTSCILEIACGYGRWTHFLLERCQRMIVIDLSGECIAACKERFSAYRHIEYHVNDGKSLAMIPDGSVDFVFSFDSLVHANKAVMEAYLAQLPRILKHGGAAFIHHSNLGEYRAAYSRIRRVPKLKGLLAMLGVLDKYMHWRDDEVSAEMIEQLAAVNGLHCVSQEILRWGTKRAYIDCFSTILNSATSSEQHLRVFRNTRFADEVSYLATLSQYYAKPGLADGDAGRT